MFRLLIRKTRAGAIVIFSTNLRQRKRPVFRQSLQRNRQRSFQTDNAKRRLIELAVFFVRGVRRVIGRDAINRAVGESRDNRVGIGLRAQAADSSWRWYYSRAPIRR